MAKLFVRNTRTWRDTVREGVLATQTAILFVWILPGAIWRAWRNGNLQLPDFSDREDSE